MAVDLNSFLPPQAMIVIDIPQSYRNDSDMKTPKKNKGDVGRPPRTGPAPVKVPVYFPKKTAELRDRMEGTRSNAVRRLVNTQLYGGNSSEWPK